MPIEHKMPTVLISDETAYSCMQSTPSERHGYATTEIETMRRYLMDAARLTCSSVSERVEAWKRISNLTDASVITEYKGV